MWASKRVGRPIKWTAERSESFLTDAHGRDHVTTAELALDKDGKFLALRVDTTANMGAYLSTFASCIPTILYATLLAGQYATPHIYCRVQAVFTNTAPVDAVSRCRPSGSDLRPRTHRRARGARTQDRSGRTAPTQFHPQVSVRDARWSHLRHRRLRGNAQARAGNRRRQRICGAQGRERSQGAAARYRLLLLHRGLRHRAVEYCRRTRRARGPLSKQAKCACIPPAR